MLVTLTWLLVVLIQKLGMSPLFTHLYKEGYSTQLPTVLTQLLTVVTQELGMDASTTTCAPVQRG